METDRTASPATCAAIAILNAGGINDGVQQQTQRVDENMPLLALDQFARIEPVRIDAGPPRMGSFLSSGFRAATSFRRDTKQVLQRLVERLARSGFGRELPQLGEPTTQMTLS